jgi:hypothetical protein
MCTATERISVTRSTNSLIGVREMLEAVALQPCSIGVEPTCGSNRPSSSVQNPSRVLVPQRTLLY